MVFCVLYVDFSAVDEMEEQSDGQEQLKTTDEKHNDEFPFRRSGFLFFFFDLKTSSHSPCSLSPSDQTPRRPKQGVSLPRDASQVRFRLVDAKDQVVGRLAAQLARILQGKDKPTFSPGATDGSGRGSGGGSGGDVVVVKNAALASFTGRKWDDKLYRWHSGFPGGLKERAAGDERARDPTAPLRRAVYGMLPKNALRASRARRLRVFAGEAHAPFEGDPRLVPWAPPPRTLRVKEAAPELPDGFAPLNAEAFARRFRAHRGCAPPGPGAGDGSIPKAAAAASSSGGGK